MRNAASLKPICHVWSACVSELTWGDVDSHGLTWIRMTSNGVTWFDMNWREWTRIHMDWHDLTWIEMNWHGLTWIHTQRESPTGLSSAYAYLKGLLICNSNLAYVLDQNLAKCVTISRYDSVYISWPTWEENFPSSIPSHTHSPKKISFNENFQQTSLMTIKWTEHRELYIPWTKISYMVTCIPVPFLHNRALMSTNISSYYISD